MKDKHVNENVEIVVLADHGQGNLWRPGKQTDSKSGHG